jgi:predicted phosphoribosyltransferase
MWEDRVEAGQELAKKLIRYRSKNVVVYGLPRGGVAVAAEVAKYLSLPIDVIIARKIGHPFNSEYAVAAVTETGELVTNEFEVSELGKKWLEGAAAKEKNEAKRRRKLYTGQRKHISAKNRVAVVIDDGIATGLTLKAAIKQLKKEHPTKIVVAVPVTPDDTAAEIETEVDEMICLHREHGFFGSVGSYYQRFQQTEDQDVIDILEEIKETKEE